MGKQALEQRACFSAWLHFLIAWGDCESRMPRLRPITPDSLGVGLKLQQFLVLSMLLNVAEADNHRAAGSGTQTHLLGKSCGLTHSRVQTLLCHLLICT